MGPRISHGLKLLLIAAVVWLAGWFSSTAAYPEVVRPCNIAVVLPMFVFRSEWLGPLPIVIFALAWCWKVDFSERRIPARSRWLLVALVLLSVWWTGYGVEYSFGYHGPRYTWKVMAINAVCWLVLIGMLVWQVRKPSSWMNYLLHLLLFVWLTWYAFPWFGELP